MWLAECWRAAGRGLWGTQAREMALEEGSGRQGQVLLCTLALLEALLWSATLCWVFWHACGPMGMHDLS